MLTRESIRNLRDELQTHLDAISAEIGYKLTLGNASFGATVTFKLEAAPMDMNGDATSKTAEDFKRGAYLFGLQPTDLGREFIANGARYKVTGLAIKSRRFPILVEREDGKVFKFPAETVKLKLA